MPCINFTHRVNLNTDKTILNYVYSGFWDSESGISVISFLPTARWTFQLQDFLRIFQIEK